MLRVMLSLHEFSFILGVLVCARALVQLVEALRHKMAVKSLAGPGGRAV